MPQRPRIVIERAGPDVPWPYAVYSCAPDGSVYGLAYLYDTLAILHEVKGKIERGDLGPVDIAGASA